MPYSAADIAAFVGAAAWLPQVTTWIYRAATKPTLTIIPDKAVEIGFTTFGPIFNLKLALAADRKDIIITKLAVKVTHEDGDRREFTWQGMTETFSSIRDRSGVQQGSFERDQEAIALKVPTTALVEKFFRFQEDRFHNHVVPLLQDAVQHRSFLESKTTDFRDEFLKSEKYFALVNAHKELFWWRSGKYVVQFVVVSSQKPRLPRQRLSFALSQADVDALRGNLDLIGDSFENQLKASLPGYTFRQLFWVWRRPPLVAT